ncbi:TPA: hypothetical protein U5Z31_002100 [Streptococcus agalactiae]|nr:hypothetical protein [Streptococcus agalactiae]HEN4401154.1 hypothetical protein [Streptococcus agalactiae]HEN4409215.1 hypothetical protein [Streptococcus agalactiae]HEN4411427.1 hypothetical protein [Streptococcus agalactiae]HEN4413572.1 hypothetical protein [Streptococcus agalactiae]
MIPKFRAWSKKFKRMYEVTLIDYENGDVGLKDDHGGVAIGDIKQLILMQSTGMFDKNGVEVFDGDIMFYEQDCYQYTLVKYDKDKLAFVLYDGCERLYHELWEPGEVIGNIYENPELLESVEE